MTTDNHLDESTYDAEQIKLMKEQCIRVDESDQIMGGISKKQAHLMCNIEAGEALHRAFSVFYFHRDSSTGHLKLLLQQRALEKITFPGYWTNTCCSHPLYDLPTERDGGADGCKVAAIRKLEHELGMSKTSSLSIQQEDLTYLTRILYKADSDGSQWGEHEVDYILVSVKQFDMSELRNLQLNTNEVCACKFVNIQELQSMFQDPNIQLTPWFKLICNHFLFKWWQQLEGSCDISNTLASFQDFDNVHKLTQ
ncbi:hypothetical protein MIR68_008900 [Amoeboaphelidium protococcarum]|nr:hypothetical protein MIR68_008900 [Amoeboaphelidium protococcarum]